MMSPSTTLQGATVLILEDDFYLADDARAVLEDAGAQVIGPFRKEAHALDAARSLSPSCALVDLNLGDGPSFGPAQKLLALGVSVVLLTGYDRSIIPAELAHLICLQKPVQPFEIVAAIGQACSRKDS